MLGKAKGAGVATIVARESIGMRTTGGISATYDYIADVQPESGSPAFRGMGGGGARGTGGTGLGTTVADPSATAGSVQPGVGPGANATGIGQTNVTSTPCAVVVTPRFTG